MEKPTLTLYDGTVIQTPEYICKDSPDSAYVSYRWQSVGGFECIHDRQYGAKNLTLHQLKARKTDLEDDMRFHQNRLKDPHRAEMLLVLYDQFLQHMALRVIGVKHEGTPVRLMKTLNAFSTGKRTANGYFEKHILNYHPDLGAKDYNKIMELEYHNQQHLQGIANALGFTFHTCPMVVVKEYYLEKYPDDIILAKYWTARIAFSQQNATTKQRRLQKAVGFATLYGGSLKVSRLPNHTK